MKTKQILTALSMLLIPAVALEGATEVTVTKSSKFARDAVSRVAIVTLDCSEAINCSNLAERSIEELEELRLPFEVIPETALRQLYFDHDIEGYSADQRAFLLETLKLDGLIEVSVPFASRSGGWGGTTRSQTRVEVELVLPDGTVLFRGIGHGRPLNVVSSPEKLTARLIKEIFEEAY